MSLIYFNNKCNLLYLEMLFVLSRNIILNSSSFKYQVLCCYIDSTAVSKLKKKELFQNHR